MIRELKQGVLFTAVTLVLFGGVYHVVFWAIGRVAFPAQAEGSLIRRADGTIVGSRLIGQKFTGPEYFLPRPSAVDYNAASTGGTNYGPSNPDHLKAVRERLDAVTRQEGIAPGQVPSEMVTASGAGLDPHIPPNAAERQEDARLVLPDMHHFVHEQPLFAQVGMAEIVAIGRAVRMEMDPAAWAHHHAPGLEERPFAEHHAHGCYIDRIAEHRPREVDLAGGQRADLLPHARLLIPALGRPRQPPLPMRSGYGRRRK